jgi:K+-transporting ATPase ATPase A chain
MSIHGWLQVGLLLALVAISTPILGNYLARLYTGQKVWGDRVWRPIERSIYRVSGIDPEGEQRWSAYVVSLLVFTVVGIAASYLIFRLQAHLPFNADHMKNLSPGQAFNEAVSYGTNTDWQSYAGESTMSHLSQMLGIVGLHFFVSSAVGMALAAAFIRGLTRRRRTTVGNFWVDTIRTCFGVMIPITFVFALVFMSQGVIQNFHASKSVTTAAVQSVDAKGNPVATQSVPGGPIASMVSIEALGDNGGGAFNANMAHPFQNPNGITNVLFLWLFMAIPFAFPWAYGKMVGSMRQGMVVLSAMAILFSIGMFVTLAYETHGNPKLAPAGVTQAVSSTNPGGNLEGKDLRIGTVGTTFDANAVVGTSAGMNSSAHESYTPVGGATVMFQIMLGEVDPGGTGTGLYGLLIMVFISVFIAGLMVGRTPEYLGKKVTATEVKLAALYVLVLPFTVLVLASASIVTGAASKSLSTGGAHGLTEMVYAFTSLAHNNGTAFGGLTANTTWFNVFGSFTMWAGRFALVIPALAIAGALVRKRPVAITAGSLRTDTPLFTGMIVVVTFILTGLTYFPALALGPLAEHLTGHF